MMEYSMLTIAVTMFSVQFLFNQIYQSDYGNDMQASFVMNALNGFFGIIALVLINGAKFEYTHFTFIMAFLNALNSIAFTYFSLKALGKINLSLYSVFTMLGGMLVPFVVGILFYSEPLTWTKAICLCIVGAAIFVTFEKKKGTEKGEKKGGTIYYIAIFMLNGMSGVLSKIFQSAPYEKASAAGYSILAAMLTVIIAIIVLFITGFKKRKIKITSVLAAGSSGILERVANWLLVIALSTLPASVQYPFVTGGVMIMSTIVCTFTSKKPSVREWVSVALSFVGLFVLMLG